MCPKTGHPDFGKFCFGTSLLNAVSSSKALKMYCQSFRQEGIYYEAVTNRSA